MLSIGLPVLGLVLLIGALSVPYRALRRFRTVRAQALEDVGERSGLLKARMAGLRVALDERRHRPIH